MAAQAHWRPGGLRRLRSRSSLGRSHGGARGSGTAGDSPGLGEPGVHWGHHQQHQENRGLSQLVRSAGEQGEAGRREGSEVVWQRRWKLWRALREPSALAGCFSFRPNPQTPLGSLPRLAYKSFLLPASAVHPLHLVFFSVVSLLSLCSACLLVTPLHSVRLPELSCGCVTAHCRLLTVPYLSQDPVETL